MNVVGVWSARGQNSSVEVAQRAVPRARASYEVGGSALVTESEDDLSNGVARVGEVPTASEIIAHASGLTLRRGPVWCAPIYYRIDRDGIVASSHIAPLVRSTDRPDFGSLACRIGFVCHDDETRTPYREIHSLRPFEELQHGIDGAHATIAKTPSLKPEKGEPRELALELQRRLLAAISRCAGNGTVAVMVSGGLDSTTVLAGLLTTREARDLRAVTIDFDGPASDRPYVTVLEKHFGVPVTRLQPRQGWDDVRSTLLLDASPGYHAADGLGYTCAHSAEQLGADVLLTGAGGDEVLGGDFAIAFGTRLKTADLRAVPDALKFIMPFYASPWFRLRNLAAPFLRPHVPRWVQVARANRRLRDLDWAGRVLLEEHRRRISTRVKRPEGWTPEARYDALAREPRLRPFVEGWNQLSVLGGARRRDPIYDDDVVRFSVAVPPETHVEGGVYRSLQRRAMKGYLPELIHRRVDKADFQDALAGSVWPIEDLRPFLSFSHLADAGIVNPKPMQAFLQPLLDRPTDPKTAYLWLYFWAAVASEAFLRER